MTNKDKRVENITANHVVSQEMLRVDLSRVLAPRRAMTKSQLRKMGIRVVTPEAERKCALPGCTVKTTHHGGYCCPEHCRQHREMKR